MIGPDDVSVDGRTELPPLDGYPGDPVSAECAHAREGLEWSEKGLKKAKHALKRAKRSGERKRIDKAKKRVRKLKEAVEDAKRRVKRTCEGQTP